MFSDYLRDEMFSAATIEAFRGGGGEEGMLSLCLSVGWKVWPEKCRRRILARTQMSLSV